LGGHHGANDLARRISQLTGAVAAITTAGDLRLGLALDDPPPGWRVADTAAVKTITAALLADDAVDLVVEAAEPECDWLRAATVRPAGAAGRSPLSITVTDRAKPGDDRTLVFHPATLAVGIGCERGASTDEVRALVHQCLAQAGLSPLAVA